MRFGVSPVCLHTHTPIFFFRDTLNVGSSDSKKGLDVDVDVDAAWMLPQAMVA